ncbi:MAG: type II toxin-antitoxin system VapC family toxin [Anaerolineae bacterium]|nr:MAG: type II toxin-antitoxin system VapC family toxin [Anaerolineae bacterium]
MADYLLDTHILILALRRHAPTLDTIQRLHQQGLLHISVVTRAEVLSGMHAHEETRTLNLLDSLNGLAVDMAIADQAGRWVYHYAPGVQLSVPDALIAATARRHSLTLVTTNAKHFPMGDIAVHGILVSPG